MLVLPLVMMPLGLMLPLRAGRLARRPTPLPEFSLEPCESTLLSYRHRLAGVASCHVAGGACA